LLPVTGQQARPLRDGFARPAIDAGDFVSLLKQESDKTFADITRSADHANFHDCSFF
jgi:hypothetical protein